MTCLDSKELADRLIATAQAAGRAELAIYNQDFEVIEKSDGSPVTAADQAAEVIILKDLEELAPDIPVVAEEAASAGEIPDIGERFFLVDPLDGTKEFVRRNGEFTINIGLIEKGKPVFGLVYAPAIEELFIALDRENALMTRLAPGAPTPSISDDCFMSLNTRVPPEDGLAVVASKSHMTDETRVFIDKLPVSGLRSAGSSLKFCLLAKAEADVYPRFGPTMEWDTAAGHAVLAAAGGLVAKENGEPLMYGKNSEGFRNSNFIAWGKPPADTSSVKWQATITTRTQTRRQ